ncbi:MAG: right-handed parallel beta-helix repeat-containing protein [Candidatus Coatesbacteria bacterium]|nr:right-handed parallel beta-helix repeat-containing protein [Candidatus Coatesbacteria bacterium]
MFRREIRLTLAALLVMLCVMAASAFAVDRYVDAGSGENGTNGHDGTLGHAWRSITYALDQIKDASGTNKYSLHVAAGTYDTTIETKNADGTGGPAFPLQMKSYVSLYGADPQTTIIDAFTAPRQDGGVIEASGSAHHVTISRFTITNGYFGEHATQNGPGICANGVHGLEISFCRINHNTACDGDGGGIYLNGCNDPRPWIHDCCIEHNYVEDGSQGFGGGIYCNQSDALIENVLLAYNTASNGCGGGFYSASSNDTLFNCLFVGNVATGTDTHHYLDGLGGGAHCDQTGDVVFTNCTFSGNVSRVDMGDGKKSETGGAIYTAKSDTAGGDIHVLNCILWGDVGYAGQTDELAGTGRINVSHSDVQGGYTGDGTNLDADPKFCSRGDGTDFDGYFLVQAITPCKSVALGDGDDADRYGTGAANSNTKYSTATNGLLDNDQVDMGYHYVYHECTYIELVSFEARPCADRIVLNWETGSEIDNAGFVLFRSVAGTGDYVRISGLIGAEGDPAFGASYSLVDRDVEPGVAYNYWLVDIDTSGKWTAHGPASARLLMSLKPIQLPAVNRQLATVR